MEDNVKIINMTRKFLEFYNATHHNMDAVEIYNIWKDKYGFAAVPPGDQDQKIVLDSLFKVYPNYAKAIQTIETFTPDESTIYDSLTQVKSCLGFHESIYLVVIYFVGFFENNAFVAPYDENTLALCLPIENDSKPLEQKMVLVHELTYIVHAKTSNSNGDWIRPVANIVVQEGLAMKVCEKITFGLEDYQYLTDNKAWFESCKKSHTNIMRGIQPYLDNDDSETILKFTMGQDTTNHIREAYYVGWQLFDTLLSNGFSLEKIANIKAKDLVNFVYKALNDFE